MPADDPIDAPLTGATVPDAGSGPVDLAALPVALEFVIGSADVPLAQLAQAREGELLPIQLAGHHGEVEVRCQGAAVASGRLVRVGESLCVELLQRRVRDRDAVS